MVKLLVAGGRDFTDKALLELKIQEIADRYEDISIITGMARGADSLAHNFAVQNNMEVHCFPADWDKYGKAAGMIRNKQMGNFADTLLVFWDGKSKGTKNMIDYMESLRKPMHIVMY